MLIPRNPVVSTFMVGSYAAMALHGVTVFRNPPESTVAYIGDPTWHWAIAAIFGAVVSIFGYLAKDRGRLVEAFGVLTIAYSMAIYLYGSASVLLFSENAVSREPQVTSQIAFILLLLARASTLIVLYYRRSKQLRALRIVAERVSSNGPR